MKLAQGFDDIIFQEKMQPCLYIIRQFCDTDSWHPMSAKSLTSILKELELQNGYVKSASNYAPIDIWKKKHFNASLLKWADVSMSGL